MFSIFMFFPPLSLHPRIREQNIFSSRQEAGERSKSMKRLGLIILMAILVIITATAWASPMPTSTRTPTATPTRTPTRTPTATPTRTPIYTPTSLPTETPIFTPTAVGPTSIPTETPVITPTPAPTETPWVIPGSEEELPFGLTNVGWNEDSQGRRWHFGSAGPMAPPRCVMWDPGTQNYLVIPLEYDAGHAVAFEADDGKIVFVTQHTHLARSRALSEVWPHRELINGGWPKELVVDHQQGAALLTEDAVYLAGGYDPYEGPDDPYTGPTDHFSYFDRETLTWQTGPSLPSICTHATLYQQATGKSAGDLILAGGQDGTYFLNSVLTLNPSSKDGWQMAFGLETGRALSTVSENVANGEILVTGGITAAGRPPGTPGPGPVVLNDTETEYGSSVPDLPVGLSGAQSWVGPVYVELSGGATQGGPNGQIYRLDLESKNRAEWVITHSRELAVSGTEERRLRDGRYCLPGGSSENRGLVTAVQYRGQTNVPAVGPAGLILLGLALGVLLVIHRRR